MSPFGKFNGILEDTINAVSDSDLILLCLDMNIACPPFNGVFDYQRYQQILNQNRMTTEQFEVMQKQDLRIGKLRLLIMSGVNISDEEALQWYQWKIRYRENSALLEI